MTLVPSKLLHHVLDVRILWGTQVDEFWQGGTLFELRRNFYPFCSWFRALQSIIEPTFGLCRDFWANNFLSFSSVLPIKKKKSFPSVLFMILLPLLIVDMDVHLICLSCKLFLLVKDTICIIWFFLCYVLAVLLSKYMTCTELLNNKIELHLNTCANCLSIASVGKFLLSE